MLLLVEVVSVFCTGNSPLAAKVNPLMIFILPFHRELDRGCSYESKTV
jgi:hypothetical protein